MNNCLSNKLISNQRMLCNNTKSNNVNYYNIILGIKLYDRNKLYSLIKQHMSNTLSCKYKKKLV